MQKSVLDIHTCFVIIYCKNHDSIILIYKEYLYEIQSKKDKFVNEFNKFWICSKF